MKLNPAKCLICKKNPVYGKRQFVCAPCLLAKHLKELGLKFCTEVYVTPLRKWRWDYVLTDHRIAIEIDGYFMGRHQGWGKDNDKQNYGVMLGWRPLRFSTNDVLRGRAKAFLAEHLGAKP